jgi:tRNA(Ile)-lysidine synthase
VRRHDLCPQGSRVLVALSGGSDSVALTLLLRDLWEYGGFTLVGAAHLNHQLRPSAARDEAFCRDFAASGGISLIVDCIDVGAYRAAQRLSLEEAARRVRYEFLERTADRLGADRIAVGHTEDDQAETFILKLMRGAGATGLGGIYPRRDRLIRPLLDVSREDLRLFLRSSGQSWVDDETNADERIPRNRVRHRVLPELDRAYGGPTRPAIARAAELLREDAQWLEEVSEARFRLLAVCGADRIEFDADALRAEPLPLRRRILLKALRAVDSQRQVSLDHVESADAVLDGSTAGMDLGPVRLELRHGKLVLVQQGVAPK